MAGPTAGSTGAGGPRPSSGVGGSLGFVPASGADEGWSPTFLKSKHIARFVVARA